MCTSEVIKLKTHYYWYEEDIKVPYSEKYGYTMALCGYLREHTTTVGKCVTCKHCLKEMKKRKID